MRISDWSSDVCSSDLARRRHHRLDHARHADFGDGRAVLIERAGEAIARRRQAKFFGREAADTFAVHRQPGRTRGRDHGMAFAFERSEEHTSEIQSLMRISYAVFCLKKKKQTPRIPHTPSGS